MSGGPIYTSLGTDIGEVGMMFEQIRARMFTPMSLLDFPFDTQWLEMTVGESEQVKPGLSRPHYALVQGQSSNFLSATGLLHPAPDPEICVLEFSREGRGSSSLATSRSRHAPAGQQVSRTKISRGSSQSSPPRQRSR